MSRAPFELENIIYRAGAGAGKTTTLVNHVVSSAEEFHKINGRFPKMIVTTFTRKSTQELRERLLREGQTKNNPELLQFFLSQRELHISTIHGVLHLLLHRFGSQIGLDPGFSFLDSGDSMRRSKKILRPLLYESQKYEELLKLLGFNVITQRVRDIEKALRFAPETSAHTIVSLKSAITDYMRILAYECLELSQDINKETTKADWTELATFLEALSKALPDFFKNQKYLSMCYEGRRKPAYSKTKPPVSEELNLRTAQVLDKVKNIDNEMFKLENLEIFSLRYQELQALTREYADILMKEKMRTGRIEIDDLELLSLQLLKELPAIADAFSKEWDYWLIDEFQDTSPLQVELLNLMRGQRPHLVVGDPQQSIYFFRGARSEVFVDKEKEILALGGRKELLNRNYRSTPELLLFLNDLVQDFGVGFAPMLPKEEGAFDSSKCAAIFGKAADELEEFNFIAKQIQDLQSHGVTLEKICILSRKNSTLKSIAQHLNQFGIATQVHAASGFFNRREILDLVSLLKFLVNPHDNDNLVEVLRSPWFRLPDQTIVDFARTKSKEKENGSLWSYIAKVSDGEYALDELRRSLIESQKDGVIAAFENMMIRSGLVDVSHYHDSTGQRESNIWKFLFRLREESRRAGFHILNFIKNSQKTMSLDEFSGDVDASPAFEPNRVNLMTIHMSKGLQFDYVFIPKMDAKPDSSKRSTFTFEPSSRLWCCELPMGEDLKTLSPLNAKLHGTYLSEQEVLESERLFYVAVTRAKERVYLSFSEGKNENSWFSKMKWPLEYGKFQNSFYTYKVEGPAWQVDIIRKRQDRAQAVRAPVIVEERSLSSTQNISVSRVLDLWEPKGAFINKPLLDNVPARVERALKGTLVHKLFEALHYHGFEKADEFINSYISDDKKSAHQALDFVLKSESLPLKHLIEQGEVEWGFLARFGRTTLEGQIDLWGKTQNTVWIVDYKTGDPSYSYRAQQQLALYALAVKMSGVEGEFKLAAVFPMHQKIHTFEAPDFDELKLKLNQL